MHNLDSDFLTSDPVSQSSFCLCIGDRGYDEIAVRNPHNNNIRLSPRPR